MFKLARAAAVALPLSLVAATASAQPATTSPTDAAFVTCRQGQAMTPDQRKTLALDLMNRAAKYYNIAVYDGQKIGEDLGFMVRAGCTIYPEHFLLPVIARAVRAAGNDPAMGTYVSPGRSTTAEPTSPAGLGDSVFVLCQDAMALPPERMQAMVQTFGTAAAKHFNVTQSTDPAAAQDLQNMAVAGCKMFPDHLAYAIVARSVAATAEGRAPSQASESMRPTKVVKPPKP